MTDHKNPITQKYLELEQQLSFELTAFSQNVSALKDAPTQEQYDRFCGHLNYIQLLLSDADRFNRSMSFDRNDPAFYPLLEAKDHIRQHGITYASLRGSFFQQYSREEELDEHAERILVQEEKHPELEDVLPSQETDLPQEDEQALLDEQQPVSDLASQKAEADAKAEAAKKKKRISDQRRLEELRRRQLLEQEELAEIEKRAAQQAYYQQQETEELQRASHQEQAQQTYQAQPDIHQAQAPEPHDAIPLPNVSRADPHPAPQPEFSDTEAADSELQRARWEEARRLGIHQNPDRDISQAELMQERFRQEEEQLRMQQANDARKAQHDAVQEHFHQRMIDAEQHVRLEKGHVDFSRDTLRNESERTASSEEQGTPPAPDVQPVSSRFNQEHRDGPVPPVKDAGDPSSVLPPEGAEIGQNSHAVPQPASDDKAYRDDQAFRSEQERPNRSHDRMYVPIPEDAPQHAAPNLSYSETDIPGSLPQEPRQASTHAEREDVLHRRDSADIGRENDPVTSSSHAQEDLLHNTETAPTPEDRSSHHGWHNQTLEPDKQSVVPPLAPAGEKHTHTPSIAPDTPDREVSHAAAGPRTAAVGNTQHQQVSDKQDPSVSAPPPAPASDQPQPDWYQRRQERQTDMAQASAASDNGKPKVSTPHVPPSKDHTNTKQTAVPHIGERQSRNAQNAPNTAQSAAQTAAQPKPGRASAAQSGPASAVFEFTPSGVREDLHARMSMQPSRNNAQIYESIKKGMSAPEGSTTPVTLSSAYVSNMAWNVHMARIDYQSKKDTAEALNAVHHYQRQRQALNNLKADIRAGRIVLEDPKPTAPQGNQKPASNVQKPSQTTQYNFTPQGVSGTVMDPSGKVTGATRLNTRVVKENFRYNSAQPLFVSPKYEQAMQQRLDRATTVLDTALKLDQKLPPKISAELHSELRLAQDAYAAFKQAKTTGAVVISDQSKLERPDFHTWQQRKQANIFGTTVHSKAGDLNKPKKEAVEEQGASILHQKSKLRYDRLYQHYGRILGNKTMSYAWNASNIFSRNLYMLAQMGEDNALRTFETGRYYTVAAVQLGYAVTHLHVVAPNKYARQTQKVQNQVFAKYVNKDMRTLSREIGDKKRLARENKKVLQSLRIEQAQLKDQINALLTPGKTLTKEESLLLKQLGARQRKVGDKLTTLQQQQRALNNDLRREVAFVKLRKKNADELRVLRQLREKHGPYITKGMLRRDIQDTQELGRAQLLKKYGKKLTAFSDKAVKAEIKNLTKQGKAIKAQIKLLQSKGSALNQAQRQALKNLMDEHKKMSKKLSRLIALNKDRAAINAELALKSGLLNRMYKNSAAFSNSLLVLKQFILRPLREGAEYGVQGFAAGFGVLTNRQVHRMMKKVFKASIRYVPAAALTLVTGDVHAASSMLAYTSRASTMLKVKSRKFVKGQVKTVKKLAVKGAKKTVSAITPKPVKKGAHYAVKTISGKFKTLTAFRQKISNRFWSSSFGRDLSAVRNFGSNTMQVLKTATKFLKSVAIKVVAGFVLLFLICGVVASMAGAPAGGAASSVILSPYDGAEGKLNLGPYTDILNDCQAKYDQEIEDLKATSAARYDKVTINPAIPDNNMREILSMMAVRCMQDLTVEDNPLVQNYLQSIFEDSHFYTTEESELYSCAGCKTKRVPADHKSTCADDCTVSHTEKVEYCPGDHQDLTITLHVLFFDEIFTADSMGNAGQTAVAGEKIGNFRITHYCACAECCGKDPSDPYFGITATGTVATEGRTIAVDKNVIPLGTHVVIDGVEYIAEDTGGAIKGNRIDIYISDHDRAYQLGVKYRPVYYASYEGESIVETGEWEGWNPDNITWCKTIYSMDWSELYTGIPNVTDVMGNETSLDGVTFIDGERAGNEAIVNTAMSQLGQHGGQPYWSWYGFSDRVEWCATFVSWCANQNGVLGTSVPKFASCRYEGVPWFQSHNQWASGNDIVPVAGDIIFFDWEGDGVPNHVGIVVGTDGSKVYTIEGNSGDVVRSKSYNLDSKLIFGYGLPNY